MAMRLGLTKAGVDEAVPAAAGATQQPLAADAGRKAERGAEQAHQHVAHADIEEHHVDRRAQLLEFAEEEEHDEVVEEAESHDKAQHHGEHDEARSGELAVARRRLQQPPVIAQVEAVVETGLTREHPIHRSRSSPVEEPLLVTFAHLESFRDRASLRERSPYFSVLESLARARHAAKTQRAHSRGTTCYLYASSSPGCAR